MLIHLLFVEIVGESTNEDLLQRVRNNSADNSWDASEPIHATSSRDWLSKNRIVPISMSVNTEYTNVTESTDCSPDNREDDAA